MFPAVKSSSVNNHGPVFRLPDEDPESEHHLCATSYPQFFNNDMNDDDSDGDIHTVKTNTSLTLNSNEDNAAVLPLPATQTHVENGAALFPGSPFSITTAHVIREDDEKDFAADDERETSHRSSSRERSYRNRSVRPKREGSSTTATSTSFPPVLDWNHTTATIQQQQQRPRLVTPTMASESTKTSRTVSTSSQSTPEKTGVYHYLIDERLARATNNGMIRTTIYVPGNKPSMDTNDSTFAESMKQDRSSIYSSCSSPSTNGKSCVDISPLNESIVEPMLLHMSSREEVEDMYPSPHDDGSPFVDESSYSFSLGGGNLGLESPSNRVNEDAAFPTVPLQSAVAPNLYIDTNWIKTSWSYLQMMAQTASSSMKISSNNDTIVDLDNTVVSSQPSITNNTCNNDILSLNGNGDQLTYDSRVFQNRNENGDMMLIYNNHRMRDDGSTLPSTGSIYEYSEYMMNNNTMSQQMIHAQQPALSDPVKMIHTGTQSTFIIAYGSSEDDSTTKNVAGDNSTNQKNLIHNRDTIEVMGLASTSDDESISRLDSKNNTSTKKQSRRCIYLIGTILVVLILTFAVSEVVCIFFSCRYLGFITRQQISNEDKSVENSPRPKIQATPIASPLAIPVPTSTPSLRVVTIATNGPSSVPTALSTMADNPQLTITPTFNTNITLKFNTTDELYIAVDQYLLTYSDSSNRSPLPPIEQWDVSQLYNLSKVFSALRNPMARYFNADLSLWNTSNVVYMGSLFQQAEIFNGDIKTWDTSRVIDMYETFASAYQFNQDISLWNVAKVQQMSRMFLNCAQFNQNIGMWNTSSAISMEGLFKNAPSFNQDLFWDTTRVSEMSQMFEDADAFNGDISMFNTSAVLNMSMMFRNAVSFTGSSDLSLWDVSNVQDAREMFYGAVSFLGIGLTLWTIDSLVTPTLMFAGAQAFSQNLCTNWHSNLLLLDGTKNMFAGTSCPDEETPDSIYPDRSTTFCFLCFSSIPPTVFVTAPPSGASFTGKPFETADELRRAVDEYVLDDSSSSYIAFQYGYPIGYWDVSLISDFSQVFDSNRNTNLLNFNGDLSGWNVSNAVNMYAMFQQTISFTDATNGLASWDVSKVTDMSEMFASSAFSGNISNWQVDNVIDFRSFAEFAASFSSDLSMWNVSSAQYMSWMFRASKSFNSNISNWDVSSVTDFSSMFAGASSFSQNLCSWGLLIQMVSSNMMTNMISPTIETRSMFAATACPYLLEPNMTSIATGPWCTACIL